MEPILTPAIPSAPPQPTLISAYEARTHWSSITDRVMAGESFILTKHNRVLGRLVPETGETGVPPKKRSRAEIAARFAALRAKAKPLSEIGMTVTDLIHEGRRYQ